MALRFADDQWDDLLESTGQKGMPFLAGAGRALSRESATVGVLHSLQFQSP